MNAIEFGDCRQIMRRWASHGVKVQTCVTSPPYFGLRDYGVEGQLGLEDTPEQYIAAMVEVFRCVRDLLADDGTLWVNIGDSYNSIGGGYSDTGSRGTNAVIGATTQAAVLKGRNRAGHSGLKAKDLIGIPWMLAFALRADGSDWHHEPGSVWLDDFVFLKGLRPIKCYTHFEYTHWREQSLWRGKVYANVQDQGHNVAIWSKA